MNNDLKTRMAQYEQELMRMRQQSRPTPPPPKPPAPPAPPSAFPKPPVVPTPPLVRPPIPAPPPPSSTVDVRVINAANGMPIRGAIVSLDRRTGSGREPVAVRFTDANGNITRLSVAAGQPNTVYDITVAAPGFFRQTDTGIVADGKPIRREVRLIPLPEL